MGSLVGKGRADVAGHDLHARSHLVLLRRQRSASISRPKAEVRRTGKKMAELPVTLILADGSVHPGQGKDRLHRPRRGYEDRHAAGARGVSQSRRSCFAPACLPGSRWTSASARTASWCRSARWRSCRARTLCGSSAPDNKATQRAVKVGETIGENVLILEGSSRANAS